MATIVPISQLPFGVVPTISALRAISVATISDGATVQVNGSGSANDGFQSAFVFQGASALTDNGMSIIGTPTTGNWVRCSDGPYVPSLVQTASYSGVGETLILVSGNATQVIVTLPPSNIVFGQQVVVKSLSTGAFQVRATGADVIYPATGVGTVAFMNLQATGSPSTILNTVKLQVGQGAFYQL